MKMMYKCLPENENRGIRCKISLKKEGHHGVGSKKGIFFDVDYQKWVSFSV